MLSGIHPILTGELLLHLDHMGHSDSVAIVDAHFPGHRLGSRLVRLPGLTSPQVLGAIRSVVPPDDAPALDLMASLADEPLPVQRELIDAARLTSAETQLVDRFAFYDLAENAYLIVQTGETRVYGNALLRKGVVTTTPQEHP